MEPKEQSKRRVSLTIHGATALPVCDRDSGSSDPYVIVFGEDLPLDGKNKPKSLGKTKTVKKNLHPVWEDNISFELKGNKLVLGIYDYDFLSPSDDYIGQVPLDLTCVAPGAKLWYPILSADDPRQTGPMIQITVHEGIENNWKIFNDDDPALAAGPFLGHFKMIPSMINRSIKPSQNPSSSKAYHFFALGLAGRSELKFEIHTQDIVTTTNRGPFETADGLKGDYCCQSFSSGTRKEATAVVPFKTPLGQLFVHITFLFNSDPAAYAFFPSFLFMSYSLLSGITVLPDERFPFGPEQSLKISAPPLFFFRENSKADRETFAAGHLVLDSHWLKDHFNFEVFVPSDSKLKSLRRARRTELWQRRQCSGLQLDFCNASALGHKASLPRR